jgi:hypothetical protein
VSNINISANATSNPVTNTPSTSPTTFSAPRPEKRRKSKDESPSPFNGNSVPAPTGSGNSFGTGSKETTGVKKPKGVASPCAISPVLLECPEQDCSKKYKHANGLKYHQSHAHGIISNADDDSLTAPDSPSQRSQSPPNVNSVDLNFSQKINFESTNDPKGISESTPKAAQNVDRPSSSASGENVSLADTNSSHPFTEAISKPSNSGTSTTPTQTKQDTQGAFLIKQIQFKIKKLIDLIVLISFYVAKTNIMRFANSSDMEQTSNDSMSDTLQSQSSNFYSLQGKGSSSGKNKKGRKSPVAEPDTEICTINKSEGVRSPAYSDISDDSNTATENNLNGNQDLVESSFKLLKLTF